MTDVLSPPVDTAVLVGGAVLLSLHERSVRALLATAVVLAALSTVVLSAKYGVARRLPHTPWWTGSQGFPSGHTATTSVCLGTLALLVGVRRPRLAMPLLMGVAALTVLVAAALVYADYHWLTDTLASIGLGAAAIGALSLERVRAILLTRSAAARRYRRRPAPARTPR